MYCKLICGTLIGIKGTMIEVEVDISEGFPKLDIVGMAGSTIKEAKERVRTGIKNAGYRFPYKRITINLAPAHIRKEGVAFDLPIALGILCCEGVFHKRKLERCLFIGELALNGDIRPVKGVLSLVDEAKKNGISRCIVPYDNLREALMIENMEVVAISNLNEAVLFLKNDKKTMEYLQRLTRNVPEIISIKNDSDKYLDFNQVVGQKKAKRGLEIAVSGMHHAMLIGPPGIGKTMITKRVKTILPPLSRENIVELTKIYSAAEKLISSNKIIGERPFRNPHHSITRASFIGGSSTGKPGEISLAHNGVLMLDEFPEFKREVIESLREPLEQGMIILSRSQNVFTFPARFILIAAMNPCPCGFYPNLNKCQCLPSELARYQNKISGPILDRIDLHIEMTPISYEKISSDSLEESSCDVLSRVLVAREIQKQRYKDEKISYNSELTASTISNYCITSDSAKTLLENAYKSLGLSSRSYHRLLKVSRTIADLDSEEVINSIHVAEAVTFRSDKSGASNKL